MILLRQEDGGSRRFYEITDRVPKAGAWLTKATTDWARKRESIKVQMVMADRQETAYRFVPRVGDGSISPFGRPGKVAIAATRLRAAQLLDSIR